MLISAGTSENTFPPQRLSRETEPSGAALGPIERRSTSFRSCIDVQGTDPAGQPQPVGRANRVFDQGPAVAFDKIRQVSQAAVVREERLRRAPKQRCGPRRRISAMPVYSSQGQLNLFTTESRKPRIATGSVATHSQIVRNNPATRQMALLRYSYSHESTQTHSKAFCA